MAEGSCWNNAETYATDLFARFVRSIENARYGKAEGWPWFQLDRFWRSIFVDNGAKLIYVNMQTSIHPESQKTAVRCGCGNEFSVYSTSDKLTVEICSECHPFYTGQQRYVDSEGRVEKFQDKYDWSDERVSELAGRDSAESGDSEDEETSDEESSE